MKPTLSGGRERRLLTFTRTTEPQICAIETLLSGSEAAQLRRALDHLIEMGALALYRLDTRVEQAADYRGTIAQVTVQVGSVPVEAATDAVSYPATPTPQPWMLVPLWPFEPVVDGDEALTACGLCAGMPITFDALPVEDHDLMQPLPQVASRFAAWRSAVDKRAMLGTVALPGRDRAYALFASVRAG